MTPAMLRLFCLIALLPLVAGAAAAQPSREECSARLERARGQYQAQQFAEVERLLGSCIDRVALPATEMDEGFRLLTLAYLRENLLADAQATVIKHLAWSFTYEPDEIRDPPLYVALVRVTRAQLTVPPGALVASAAPAGGAPAPAQAPPQEPREVAGSLPDTSPTTVATSMRETATQPEPALETATRSTPPATEPEAAESARPSQTEAADKPDPAAASRDLALDARERIEEVPTTESVRPDPPPADATLILPTSTGDEGDESAGGDGDGAGARRDVARGTPAGRYGGGLAAPSGAPPPDMGLIAADPAAISEPLDFATVMPEIVGGQAAIRLEYPDFERRAGIEGRVVVRFVVDREGAVSGAEVLRGVNPGLDAAALAALGRLRFHPGRQNGEPVPVRTTLSFEFRAPN